MRLNMLRLRWTTDAHARWKNGHPAHRTTGVDNANWIHVETCGDTSSCNPRAGMWPPISRTNTGTVRADPTQNRRAMSVSSWFSPTSVVALPGRHSADATIGRPHLASLRMHRGGVD